MKNLWYVFIIRIVFCMTHIQSASPNVLIEYTLRKGALDDRENLKCLYERVASIPGGVAVTINEITDEYIAYLLSKSLATGIIFVAEANEKLIGAIVTYKIEPKVFSHILYEATVLVDPNFQRSGIGTALITALQDELKNNHPEIYRVNFLARVSNPAIKLYKRLGFVVEGILKGTTQGIHGKLESDVFMAWYNPNCIFPVDDSLYYATD